MTTAVPSQILIPEGRQRRALPDLTSLAESIRRIGLINPITITGASGELRLVTGECRLRAWMIAKGDDPIPVRIFEDLSLEEQKVVELEENVKRSDLTWQDQTAAIAELHAIFSLSPEWNQVRTAERIGLSPTMVNDQLQVSEAMRQDQGLGTCPSFLMALNLVRRRRARQQQVMAEQVAELTGQAPDVRATVMEAMAQLMGKAPGAKSMAQPDGGPAIRLPPKRPARPFTVLHADFLEWLPSFSGEPFSFIHCDFPYGENYHKSEQAGNVKPQIYLDTPEVFKALCQALFANLNRLTTPQAHLMFWCKSDIGTLYRVQQQILSLEGWSCLAVPLIWHKSDNRGIAPDVERQPRRIYETALMAARGDRKLIKMTSNLQAAPTDKSLHPSHKPISVLLRFFEMFVDRYTRVLDPTCGSGSALVAAGELGAAESVGLEIDKDHAEVAEAACLRAARLREASKTVKEAEEKFPIIEPSTIEPQTGEA